MLSSAYIHVQEEEMNLMTNSTTVAPASDCFLCRFDLGIKIGDMDAGALGLILLVVILLCCCSMYTCGLYFCFRSTKTEQYEAVADPEAASDDINSADDDAKDR